jgi:hypothetical protein
MDKNKIFDLIQYSSNNFKELPLFKQIIDDKDKIYQNKININK